MRNCQRALGGEPSNTNPYVEAEMAKRAKMRAHAEKTVPCEDISRLP